MGNSTLDWYRSKDNARELWEWLSHFPYSLSVDYLGLGTTTDPRSEWCREVFGQEYKRWTVYRANDYDRKMLFYFKNERDLTLFRLKWS